MAGGSGVVFDPGGSTELTYSWSLGHAANNKAEAYALLQGLVLVEARNICRLAILNNSKNTIMHLRLGTSPRDMRLESIFYRIQKEL